MAARVYPARRLNHSMPDEVTEDAAASGRIPAMTVTKAARNTSRISWAIDARMPNRATRKRIPGASCVRADPPRKSENPWSAWAAIAFSMIQDDVLSEDTDNRV